MVDRYKMKFTPYNEDGKLKKNSPQVGSKNGFMDGEIVYLPLEQRWEKWWELVDESVPPDVLERDQRDRDAFMVEAKKTAAERDRQLNEREREKQIGV